MSKYIRECIEKNKIIGVIRENDSKRAIEIANAMIDGGIKIIEIVYSNTASIVAIEELSKNKDIVVSAGSVISCQQVEKSILAGARLISSPVMELNLLKLSKNYGFSLITSASTANEAYQAWKYGINFIKLFPVKALGGVDYIADLLKAMPFLSLIPAGGVDEDDCIEYIKAGAKAVGIGKNLYDGADYKLIKSRSEQIVKKLEDYLEENGNV